MLSLKSSDFIAISLALALGCVHFSPALASIFTGISVLISIKKTYSDFPWKSTGFLLAAMVYILLLNFWHSKFTFLDLNRIVIYAPLLFVPALFQSLIEFKITKPFLYLVSLPPLWIVIASVLNYFNHYEFLSQMVLESKPLPLFSSVYHIEFSFILTSVLLFLGMFLWRNLNDWSSHKEQWLVFLLLFLGMHILSARTGLLAFWVSMLVWAVFEGNQYLRKQWKSVSIGLLVFVLLIVFTPSIKNRLVNTLEDLNAVVSGEDLNHKSFGQRWEAWRASTVIIKENAVFGVGSSQKEEALVKGHQMIGSTVDIENQVQPHNQWIQWMLEWGGLFLLFPITIMFWGLMYHRSLSIYMSFMAIFAAIQFESLLERQSGVLAVLFLLVVSGIELSRKTKLSENS